MRSGSMQARPMTDEPLDLDMHRGMAAQKATDLRRALAEVESDDDGDGKVRNAPEVSHA